MFSYLGRVLFAIAGFKEQRIFSNASLMHLRDMLHNLPMHLNLDKEDVEYLHLLFAELDRARGNTRTLMVLESNFDILETKYVGKKTGHSISSELTSEDFIKAKAGNYDELFKVAKAILFNNIDRYQRVNTWYKSKNNDEVGDK
jgi:hypothetical protein